jgi:regulator of protease activity HflC (stomatin/prohibitin superfamily)
MIELLSTVLQFFWDLVPRPVLVGPTERAVCFLFGRWGRELGPGLYVVWPAVEEWQEYCVVSQLVETAILPVTTHDGQSWQVRLVVEYEIADPLRAHTLQHDIQLQVEQLAGSTLVTTMQNNDSQHIVSAGVRKLCRLTQGRISEALTRRGVHVLSVRAVMFDQCRSFFLSQAERLVD